MPAASQPDSIGSSDVPLVVPSVAPQASPTDTVSAPVGGPRDAPRNVIGATPTNADQPAADVNVSASAVVAVDQVIAGMPDGAMVLSAGLCVKHNHAAASILGCKNADLATGWRRLFAVATGEDGVDASDALAAILGGKFEGRTASLRVQLRKPSGKTYWAEVHAARLETSGEKDTSESASDPSRAPLLVTLRDVTERRSTEAVLKRDRDFLHNIINTIPDQLLVKNERNEIVLANAAYEHSRRDHATDLINCCDDVQTPGVRQRSITDIEATVLRTGACHTAEVVRSLPEDKSTSAIVRRSLLTNALTGERFIVATSRDTTTERRHEDRLMMLASVFEGASEGVAIMNQHGVICEANPAYATMTGAADPCLVQGRLLSEAFEFDSASMPEILSAVAEGVPWSGKATWVGAGNDRSYWVSVSQSSQTRSTRMIALVSDITELEATQVKLRHQAFYDNLTGLPNRRCFRDHLNQQIRLAAEAWHEIAVCFLDLDDFKHVNDTAGHSTGDRLLQAVSYRIQQTLGASAFVTRFGGDEFAIILPGNHFDAAARWEALDRLQAVFRRPFEMPNSEARVGLSIGVTTYPHDGTDVDTLMCNADIAMYAAKAAGKNQTRTFTPQMQEAVDIRHQVQTKLQHALTDGQISLRYQPKVCSRTGASMGCEALARWQTPDGNYIPPSEFVPVAEQTGLIAALGELVIELVARQAAEWAAEGVSPHIAVNISPQQLRHPKFVQQLTEILAAENAQPEWFELEITEHAMMDDVEHSIAIIKQLSDLGFRVAVDDFGTGHSSLSYLKHFDIDTLKIDISFIRDIIDDPQSFAIVQSIIALGSGLNLQVTAEGVETQEQADLLLEIGCPVLQGYLIGRPMMPEDYAAWRARPDRVGTDPA